MTDHYFSSNPATDFIPKEIVVELAGAEHRLLTANGVFSPDHLDRGTEVLLGHLPPAKPGAILDLGSGWGPISLDAALGAAEAEVWALDVNARSRELTRVNAERLGLTNVQVVSADEIPPTLEFAEIRSNPPIRIGKPALHDLLRTWLPRLEVGGVAHLVVAKKLGANSLQQWISETFDDLDVSRSARKSGFHIIRAVQNGAE